MHARLTWLWVCIFASNLAMYPQGKLQPRPRDIAPGPLQGPFQIVVGPNVRVSKAYDKDPHYEVLLAASPSDPNLLVACTGAVSKERRVFWDTHIRTVVYASRDGGRSWTPSLDYGPEEKRIDPACEFGLGDDVYFAELVDVTDLGSEENQRAVMRVHHSADRGMTWRSPTTVPFFIDRPFISVDRTQGQYRGRVYIHGTANMPRLVGTPGISHLRLLYSDSKAEDFQDRLIGVASSDEDVATPANGVVLSDGTLVVPFTVIPQKREKRWGGEPRLLKVTRSTSGGESFDPALLVADFYHPIYGEGTEALSVPYLAADPGSPDFKDRLYLVWPDKRLGHLRIMFAYSADKGKSWSRPRVVSEDDLLPGGVEGPDNFLPVVAVNRNGVVGVSWYDRRDHHDNLGWWLRFRASLDGGETFLPSIRVSEAPSTFTEDTEWDIRAHARYNKSISFIFMLDGFFFIGGHTSGMAVDAAGVFHPLWVDNRTGVAQLWTASVSVNAVGMRNGSPDLRELVDVSPKVAVEFSRVRYDRGQRRLYVTIRLKNTSSETIEGPLVLRALGFHPPQFPSGLLVGIPDVVNAENGRATRMREGATWDFTNLIRENNLKPGEMTQEKQLIFQLSSVQPFRDGPDKVHRVLASLDAKVLARGLVSVE